MTLKQFLSIVRGYLGVHETNGNNRTIIGEKFGWNGVAWCAEFLWVCLHEAGFSIPKNAGSHELISALGKLPGWRFVSVAEARAGDLLDYTWRHVGVCEARQSSKAVIAIEGNHNDAVARAVRSNSEIARVLRPPFKASIAVPVPANPVSGHKKAVAIRNTQGWNMTLGTKRFSLDAGQQIDVLGQPVYSAHKNEFILGGRGGRQAWFRLDDLRYI